MELTPKNKRAIRIQTWSFVVLFLAVVALLAWLSTRYKYEADWTAAGRHTLSAASVALLDTMEGPVRITAFTRGGEQPGSQRLRKALSQLIERYQRHKSDITLTFMDPDLEPDAVRQLGITVEGELVVEYQNRKENLKSPSEQAVTNAMQRLLRSGQRKLVFLQGHGERKPDGEANHDLGQWTAQLKDKGFDYQALNLGIDTSIPEDAAALVIAGPQVDLLAGEVDMIKRYVEQGGNLLWLTDPGPLYKLQPLAELLGVEFKPGTIVDPTGQLLGISHPAFIVVPDYPNHAVTNELTTLTLFPKAQAISAHPVNEWQSVSLLRTLERSWAETGVMEGNIQFDMDKDLPGPLTIGLALTRTVSQTGDDAESPEQSKGDGESGDEARPPEKERTQRVVIIGDGDFLSNAYLGNGANIELGNRIVNWLSHDDALIEIPPRAAPDNRLDMSLALLVAMRMFFLFVIPLGLVITGVVIWVRRRKR